MDAVMRAILGDGGELLAGLARLVAVGSGQGG